MAKRVFLITGSPSVSKTTVLNKTVAGLMARGIRVGGMISGEVREQGIRVGFEITDLASGRHGWLAHTKQINGPKIGRYKINLEDIEKIGAKAITQAIEKSDVIAIDEIGPMELYSQKFKHSAAQALQSEKFVLTVIHAKAKDPLITMAKQRTDAKIFLVTLANRETLPQELIGLF